MNKKSLFLIPLCIGLTACGGTNSNADTFTIKSNDYNFSIKTEGNNVLEIVENDKTYDEAEMGFAKTVIEDEGIESFYEAMYYSVYLNDDVEVKLNNKDYKNARKDIFKDKISKKSCELKELGSSNKIEFDSKDGVIQGEKIVYVIEGDFKTYKDDSTVNTVKEEVLNSISESFFLANIDANKLNVEIEDDKMICTIELKNEDISDLNNDMIMAITSLERSGYTCE